MPTLQSSGTQTATVGTEHTLVDISVAGTFTLHVDLANMLAGDRVELRIYTIMLTGDAKNITYFQPYNDVQPADGKTVISVPIPNDLTDSGSVRMTLKQTNGTSRNFKWKALAL